MRLAFLLIFVIVFIGLRAGFKRLSSSQGRKKLNPPVKFEKTHHVKLPDASILKPEIRQPSDLSSSIHVRGKKIVKSALLKQPPWLKFRLRSWEEVEQLADDPGFKAFVKNIKDQLGSETLPVLRGVYSDLSSTRLRGFVAAMIGQSRDEQATGFLVETLASASASELIGPITYSLGQIGDAAAFFALSTYASQSEAMGDKWRFDATCNALGLMGSKAIPFLLKRAEEISDDVLAQDQGTILDLLSRIRNPNAIEELKGLVEKHPKATVQIMAINALERSGGEEVVGYLQKIAMEAGGSPVRFYALASLGHIGTPEAIQTLVSEVRNPKDYKSLLAAIGAISLKPNQEAGQVLADFLGQDLRKMWGYNDALQLEYYAVAGLARLGTETSTQKLYETSATKDEAWIKTHYGFLSKIGPFNNNSLLGLVADLATSSNTDPYARLQAIKALPGYQGDQIPQLREFVSDQFERSSFPQDRRELIRVMGALGDDSALIDILNRNTETLLKIEAATALVDRYIATNEERIHLQLETYAVPLVRDLLMTGKCVSMPFFTGRPIGEFEHLMRSVSKLLGYAGKLEDLQGMSNLGDHVNPPTSLQLSDLECQAVRILVNEAGKEAGDYLKIRYGR